MSSRLYDWFDRRLNLKPVQRTLLDEPIPWRSQLDLRLRLRHTLSVSSCRPPPACSWRCTTRRRRITPTTAFSFIETEITFGWFVRGLHHWGASAMVMAIGLHMLQTFLYGAYKPPREVDVDGRAWCCSSIVMTFAFTGYLLALGSNGLLGDAESASTWWARCRWWGISCFARSCVEARSLGALTLSRFFAIHVLFLPAVI
jgi:ubiquinol-cytochrome c reductase cytochrome b subunit